MPDLKQESIKEQVLKEYTALASDYDQKWLSYTQKTLALTMKALEPEEIKAKQSLLDIGCGTGQFLEMVQNRNSDIDLFGIEPNLEMLSRARAKFTVHIPSITLVEAWAHQLPFEDASFDYLTCNNMFHYVDEPSQALSECKRVLKPGGSLILMDWCADYWTMRLNATYLDLRKKAHVKTYRGAELRDMLLQSDFSSVWVELEKVDLFWGMMVARATLIK